MAEQARASTGPWQFDIARGFILDANGKPIAQLWDKTEEDFQNACENGPLLAAAPQMYIALKEAIESCPCGIRERDSGHRIDCYAPRALEAIAKAEGRSR